MNRNFRKVKDAVKYFRKSFAKTVFDKKTKPSEVLDMNIAGSILFLRDDDKIGDMVISTLLFREVKKRYPSVKVYVLCGKHNKEIIKHNPYVDGIFEKTGKFFKDLKTYKLLKSKKIDITADFFSFQAQTRAFVYAEKNQSAVYYRFS